MKFLSIEWQLNCGREKGRNGNENVKITQKKEFGEGIGVSNAYSFSSRMFP